jgi:hypothetical protein
LQHSDPLLADRFFMLVALFSEEIWQYHPKDDFSDPAQQKRQPFAKDIM